jgi:[acyl-carrier-protein] S-malonyltransferase
LQRTDLAQPAILAHTYAIWRIISHSLGLHSAADICSVALGHSLGEYSALLIAGSIDFSPAVKLVHSRGKAMAAASTDGSMLALICDSNVPSLHLPSIESLMQLARDASCGVLTVANFNSPFQLVLSGDRYPIEFVKALIKNKNAEKPKQSKMEIEMTRGIARAIPLDVSGAFHSPLMAPALPTLQGALKQVQFRAPAVPIIFNVHAHPSTKHDRFASYLEQQLLSPVQWHGSITHALLQRNINSFIELGPAAPLTAMLRSTAQRLEKQGRVIDPTIHPADAATSTSGTTADTPHASLLPLMVPKPKVLLNDGSRMEDKDVQSILAGAAPAWGGVQTTSATDTESINRLLSQITPSIR